MTYEYVLLSDYFMGMMNRSKQRLNYDFDHHKYSSEKKRLVYQIYKDKLPHCKGEIYLTLSFIRCIYQHLYKLNFSFINSSDDAFVSKFCPTEVIGTENYKGKYIFNSTQANNYFQVTCKYGSLHGKLVVSRRCKLSASQEAYWQDVDLTSCAAKTTTSNVLIRLAKVIMYIYLIVLSDTSASNGWILTKTNVTKKYVMRI